VTTPYDTVAYPSMVFEQSHPQRTRMIARLHGVDAPPVETARILEIEPWYPDRVVNPSFYEMNGNFFHKKTGHVFNFSGQMTRRPMNYYTSKPLFGQFIIGHRA